MTVLTVHEFVPTPETPPRETTPAVALHGIRGHGRRWRTVLDTSPGLDRRWYCPDLRGHGTSLRRPPWTLEQHAVDVLDTVDHVHVDRFALVGISFGGNIAARVAARVPDRVSALVLLDPALGLEPGYAASQAGAARQGPVFASLDEARETRARYWPAAAAPVLEAEIREHLRRDDDGFYRWRYEPAAVAAAYEEMAGPGIVPPSDVSTLLVLAGSGSLVPAPYAEACAAAGAEVVGIDAGHGMDIEAPRTVYGLIHRFLTA